MKALGWAWTQSRERRRQPDQKRAESHPIMKLEGTMPLQGDRYRTSLSQRSRSVHWHTRRRSCYRRKLSERTGANVASSWRIHVDGSFKVGAANRLLNLTEEQRANGVVTVSTGNHGKATAYVAGKLGIRGCMCRIWCCRIRLRR